MAEPFLQLLAKQIAEWFPELGGRAIAVSEAEITKENIPTLPLAMLGLVRERNEAKPNSTTISIESEFVIEFWVKPERYKKKDGSEAPFWAFYDYEALRDKLLSRLRQWRAPAGTKVHYMGLDIEADHLAIVTTFRFRHYFDWCPLPQDADDPDGAPARLSLSMCIPAGTCVPEPEDETDPCERP